MERADRAHRRGDRRDIAVAAELADKAAARLQRAMDAGDDELGLPHPVQRGIGEDRIELCVKGQRMAVDLLHVQSLGRGG